MTEKIQSDFDKSAFFGAVISAFSWGLTGIFVKEIDLSSLIITYNRLLIALVIAFPVIVILRRNNLNSFLTLKHISSWGLSLLLVGYYLLATTAFKLAPVGEVALLLSISPVFVLILKWIARHKNYKNEIIGAVISVFGVLVITIPNILLENDYKSDTQLLGYMLSIVAAMLTAAYVFMFRILNTKNKPPDTLIVPLQTFFIGSLILGLYLYIFSNNQLMLTYNNDNALIFLSLGFFCTAIPTIGFSIAAKKLHAVVTATSSLLIPVFAGLLSYFILNEVPYWTIIPGGLFIIGGLVLMIVGRKKSGNTLDS